MGGHLLPVLVRYKTHTRASGLAVLPHTALPNSVSYKISLSYGHLTSECIFPSDYEMLCWARSGCGRR